MVNPNVCVLTAEGINCEMEMAHAFADAGASPEMVHINQLRSGERKLANYAILALPGGFSYGDAVASGTILANEMTAYLSDQLREFTDEKNPKPVLGICNGFQVLMKTGMLPDFSLRDRPATLTNNEIGRFECRWIDLAVGRSACRFVDTTNFPYQQVAMHTAHGEGRFDAIDRERWLGDNRQVVFRYVTSNGQPAGGYPDNPSGSLGNIAGICDQSGVILGMMPHPERSIASFHPHFTKRQQTRDAAKALFKNIVQYAK